MRELDALRLEAQVAVDESRRMSTAEEKRLLALQEKDELDRIRKLIP